MPSRSWPARMALAAALLPVLPVVVAAPAHAEEQTAVDVPPVLEADLSAAEERTLSDLTSGSGVGLEAFVVTPDGPRILAMDADSRADAAAAARLLDGQPSVEAANAAVPVRAVGGAAYDQYGNRLVRSEAARTEVDHPLSDVVVAVLDTGIAPHPELVGALVPGQDFTTSSSGGTDTTDRHGHGTHVAGTIAADTGSMVEGVAHGARVMPVKVLSDSGGGTSTSVNAGILWAADNGADVINMSLGGAGNSTVYAAAVDYARARGVTVVAAAGNDNTSMPYYPAATPGVISVAAVDEGSQRAGFSNYGPSVDLAAPGVGILSTEKSGWYSYMSGTSMATPHLAGVAALVEAAAPGLTPDQVEQALVASVTDLGDPGRDDFFGHGLVDAVRAVQAGNAVESGGAVPTNQPPTATDDPLVLRPGAAPGIVAVTGNDTDADQDRLTVTSVGGATHGAVTVHDADHVSYTPEGDLPDGTSDTFSYTVSDGRGGSATATVRVRVEALELASAPGIGAPRPSSSAVRVTWSPPVDDGGAPITEYRVHTYRSGVLVKTTQAPANARSAVITGLANGTAYTFAVAAVTEAGVGQPSARSRDVTPRTVAGKPRIGRPTVGRSAVTVRWAAPSDTGGAAITGYTVRAYRGSTVVKTVSVRAGSTRVTVRGLANGTRYRFTVAAVNAAGTGRQSPATATVTPRTVAGKPGIGRPTVGRSAVTVRWAAPSDTGGAAITGYTVRAYRGSTVVKTVSVGARSTSVTVRGLAGGTRYRFTVAAVNAAGTGRQSPATATVIPRR